MSLNHDFLLIEKSDFLENGYQKFFHSKDAVLLHDDFIDYIYDSLLWIPSIDDQGKPLEPEKGLNRWGVNFYECDGSRKLKTIISSWIEIFKCGPTILDLKGSWTVETSEEDGSESEGYYDRLIINRDDLVNELLRLVKWADEVIKSDGSKQILHLGV